MTLTSLCFLFLLTLSYFIKSNCVPGVGLSSGDPWEQPFSLSPFLHLWDGNKVIIIFTLPIKIIAHNTANTAKIQQRLLITCCFPSTLISTNNIAVRHH